jgi:putative membrane protein
VRDEAFRLSEFHTLSEIIMRLGLLSSLALLIAILGGASTRADDKAKAEDKAKPADKDKPDAKAFDDAEFVKKAASGGMHEVELGRLAAKMAKMDDVKKFGQKMVEDHTKANMELMKIAKASRLEVPTKMMEKEQKEFDHFKTMKGEEFDKEYVSHMVKDHEMDVAEFTRASKEAKSAEIKEFAAKTLPTLQEHLKMVKELQEKVK